MRRNTKPIIGVTIAKRRLASPTVDPDAVVGSRVVAARRREFRHDQLPTRRAGARPRLSPRGLGVRLLPDRHGEAEFCPHSGDSFSLRVRPVLVPRSLPTAISTTAPSSRHWASSMRWGSKKRCGGDTATGPSLPPWRRSTRPERVDAVILEALHYFAAKPRSRSFFQRMAFEPESFSEGIRRTLAAEHGEERWVDTVRHDGQAWLDLAHGAATSQTDLYGGRLHEINTPTLVVHGGCDPRTEPGELETILGALPDAQLSFHADAGHCPHAEPSGEAVTSAVVEFLGSLAAPGRSGGP